MSDFNMPSGVSARDIPGQHDGQDDGGAAFPVPPTVFSPQGDMSFASLGMSLRDYFAAKAMASLISEPIEGVKTPLFAGPTGLVFNDIASASYDMADAMLTARTK